MEKKNLSQQTMERLYTMIVVEKQIQVGEKLPNEIELSEKMGVSRATLREALRMLITRGVLQVQRGKGTFVSKQVNAIDDFGFADLEHMKGRLRDLFELRLICEPSAARLACRRATEEEMEEILALGETVAECIRRGEDRTARDGAFHAAIVRATHNEFMMRLLPIINQAVTTAIVATRDMDQVQNELKEDTLRDHAMLMGFFRQRDENGAEHAMAIHLLHGINILGIEQ